MRKEKSFKEDATSVQGEGVPNIQEKGTAIPSAESQADLTVDKSKNFTEIKTIDTPKEKTKTSQAAEVVMGSSNSAGSAGSLLRGVSFGGGAVSDIGKDASAITRADNAYRSGSRPGKRLDPITRKIDFNYPEQVKVNVRQSKPLSETTEKQGYNGNYYDEHAITQKVHGGAPADPLFNRSLDILGVDMAYFADGQYNVEKGVNYNEYKAKKFNPNTRDYDGTTVSITRGNYMPKDLTIKINANGAVGISFSEDDLSNKDCDQSTIKLCADASLRSVNQMELDRLNMVDKAGNESDPHWTPLGDAIPSATAVNTILKDLDALAGDNIFMSERKLSLALAHQINKAGKDGVRIKGPMAEMMNHNIEGAYSSAISSISESDDALAYWKNPAAYIKGSAGLWLAINDSLDKYTSKGKLLTLPQSFKLALTTAKANDAEYRVHDLLVKDVQHAELYSTIDAGYDPFNAVVITDKANVINPISLTTGDVTITKDTLPSEVIFPTIFYYHYENKRNKYTIPVRNFFVQGIHEYLSANAFKIYEKCASTKDSDGIVTITVPIQSSTMGLSLWDLIVCSAVPFMPKNRQDVMNDVIKYENNFGYPYTGVSKISEIDVDAALNYSFIDTESPISTKIANPIDAIKIKLPEVFWVVGAKAYDDHVLGGGKGLMATDTVLPHYFNQEQFIKRSSEDGALINSDNPSVISYPSSRSGVELSDFNTIYGMTEEDYRLALDRMVVYPGYNRVKSISDITTDGSDLFKYNWSTVGTNHYEIEPAKTYKYGMVSDGLVVLPYLAASERANEKDRCLTILDVMKTPRELGLHFVVPSGVLTPVRAYNSTAGAYLANYRDTSSGYLSKSGPGFTAYIYKIQGKSMSNAILQADEILISQGAAYKNDYAVMQTIPDNAQTDFGYLLSIAQDVKKTAASHTYTLDGGSLDFVPFVTGSYDDDSFDEDTGTYGGTETQATSVNGQLDVISLQKYFWARIQRLPFIVNPFDSNISDLSYNEGSGNYGNKYDIYDFLYFFGFCGFRASDYEELTYLRNRDRISYGMNYVNDPYIAKTMLLK